MVAMDGLGPTTMYSLQLGRVHWFHQLVPESVTAAMRWSLFKKKKKKKKEFLWQDLSTAEYPSNTAVLPSATTHSIHHSGCLTSAAEHPSNTAVLPSATTHSIHHSGCLTSAAECPSNTAALPSATTHSIHHSGCLTPQTQQGCHQLQPIVNATLAVSSLQQGLELCQGVHEVFQQLIFLASHLQGLSL